MSSDLAQQINLGKVIEQRLQEVGIDTFAELKQVGSEQAFIRRLAVDSSACFNELCALEGAIQGIRWHDLSLEKKAELKVFYNMVKQAQKK